MPPGQDGEFVARLEDLLDTYCLPPDPQIPLIGMDEKPVQRVKATRSPQPLVPGCPRRIDYASERNGTATLFLFTAPLQGRRTVHVRERRTALDWAAEIQDLLEVQDPEARRVRLVCDNLNTHKLGSLYAACPPETARRLAQRVEIHYTPTPGSWLNIAEVERSVLTRQCLDRRIPDLDTLRQETQAWELRRNDSHKGVEWHFTTPDARIKLKRL